MGLIDDEGNFLGIVNIVDALVVVLIVAVIVGGGAFVFFDSPSDGSPDSPSPESESEPETETTYVTLDLGTQPNYIASAINEGDTYAPGGAAQLRITDVHLTPQDDAVRVFLRVNLTGEVTNGRLMYGNAPPRLGRTLSISTDVYKVDGQIRAIGERDTLAMESRMRTVTLRMQEVDADIAEAIAPGLTERIGDRTIARVTDVDTEPSPLIAVADDGSVNVVEHPTDREVTITADLLVRETSSGPQFKGEPLRVGSQTTLDLGTVTVETTVINRGE
ncbi:DUF4330 domain-containing protein [Natronomonas sp. F2-12]|uniref:DUF4330 domain-containing protein n=1 Tax=Natronomonas aquatica TaxID=2841590 RepID=A0A9R1CSL2_9EURY|nr:DUF4330 family protein [Natronomonas aquatica]MCQ4333105.1 DUF4330 domain-containing protein [Natronomonas aquatica]